MSTSIVILIGVVVYLCLGFFACRKAGVYEGLFGGDSLEDLLDRLDRFDGKGFDMLLSDSIRSALLTIFWPIVCIILGMTIIAMCLVDDEKSEEDNDEFFDPQFVRQVEVESGEPVENHL